MIAAALTTADVQPLLVLLIPGGFGALLIAAGLSRRGPRP